VAKYKVLALSFIGDTLVQEGDEIDHEGAPGFHLEPLDAEAKRRHKAFMDSPAGKRKAPGQSGYISQLMSENGDPNSGMIPGPGAAPRSAYLYPSDTAAPTE
jgi:hypothetical protein